MWEYNFTSNQWIELCIHLVRMEIFECQILAYELLWKNKKVFRLLNYEQIMQLDGTLDNWASVDSFCVIVAGWHWREGTIPDAQIMKWLKSEDRWLRRVAVVCTIPLNLKSRGGTGDSKRTLMVCKKVIDDRDDKVVKALSWALRVLSKVEKKAVENFMKEHWERLHPRVRREVMAKMETGRKNG